MYDPILVPLDGSAFAEEIIPHALGLARSMGAKLMLLEVVDEDGDLAAAEEYVSGLARRLDAEGKAMVAQTDPASTILGELSERPGALVAMTTHGRTGLLEAILGSVALSVVQDARRPVLIYRPRGVLHAEKMDQKVMIATVMTPIDGSDFSERILPHAVEMAKSLQAKLALVQVISSELGELPKEISADVLESSYVHGQADEIGRRYGIDADWEVLHGDPADAICRYVNGRHDVMLAMSSHTRVGLRETILGSVTHECVRRAGVPVLVYRPEE